MKHKIKRTGLLIILLLLTAFILIPQYKTENADAAAWTVNSCYSVSFTGGIALKSQPSNGASTLTTIPNGTMLFVVRINADVSGWGYTCYNGKYGYIELSKATRRSDAPETTQELELRFNAIQAFYPDKSVWKGSKNDNAQAGLYLMNNGVGGPSTCFGFACELWRALFGCEMSISYSGSQPWKFWVGTAEVKGNMRVIGSLDSKAYSAADVRLLLSQARMGDIIQSRSMEGSQHTMVVESTTSEGVYIMDANVGDRNSVRVRKFYTYEDFYNERKLGISLYTYIGYPSESPLPITAGSLSVKNTSGTEITSVLPGDKVTLSASVTNARHISFFVMNSAGQQVYSYTADVASYKTVTQTCTFVFPTLTSGSEVYTISYRAWNAGHEKTSTGKRITVTAPTIKINGSDISMYVDGKTVIQTTKSPSGATVTWTSSNPSVASVNSSGEVTGKSKGTAKITATLTYKGTGNITTTVKAEVNVEVKNPNFSVDLNVNDNAADRASISTNNILVRWNEKYGLLYSLPTPTRPGYDFQGWFTAASGGTKVTNDTIVTTKANHTLYAHWTVKKFTLTFDGNSGVVSGSNSYSKQVSYRSSFGWLPVESVKKTGYTFLGWYTQPNNPEEGTTKGTKVDSNTILTTAANVTYYANWKRSVFTVSFNANGGTTPTASKSVTFGYSYGTLPTPTKQYSKFTGWYTSANGGTQVTADTVVNLTNEQTLYAHWERTHVLVTFNSNGGTGVEKRAYEINQAYSQFPTPTRNGYSFAGWYYGNTEIKATDKAPNSETYTLVAHWSANSYSVSFNPTYGTVDVDSKSVIFGQKYGKLPIPQNEGYDFLGWYTRENGTEQVTEDTVVTTYQNHTLYARWKNGTFLIMFNANGGENEIDSRSAVFDTPYGELPTAERDGYVFLGWFTRADETGVKISSEQRYLVAADQELFAHWEAIKYNVSFKTNTEESEFEEIRIEFDAAFGELPVPQKRGYTFAGWFLEDGQTEIKQGLLMTVAEDIELTASWEANKYRLLLDANTGVSEVSYIEIYFDSAYGELPQAYKYGYNFLGWYESVDGGEEITQDTMTEDDCDITVYAHWEAKTVNVSFDTAGGTVDVKSMNYIFDKTYGILPTPSRVGYSFVCWVNSFGENVSQTDTVNVEENSVFTATWEALSYTIKLNTNGGDALSAETESEYTVTYDDEYPLLPTPTRTGYRFLGWRMDDGKHAFSGETVKIVNSQILFADWIPLTYVISIDADGGETEFDSMKVSYDSTIEGLPIPARTGYEFGGWVTEKGKSITDGDKMVYAENIGIKASWTPLTYVLSFVAPEGVVRINSKIVEYDGLFGTLPIATRTGYSFAHWQTSDGRAIYSDMTVDITENTALTAVWNAMDFYVEFDSGTNEAVPSRMATYDEKFGTLPNVARDGYTFAGWYCGDDRITSESIMKYSGNICLTAHWNPITYNVTFDANDGACSMLFDRVTCDEVYSLPNATRDGYEFAGWFDENGNRISSGEAVLPANLNLNAGWKPTVYNVYFSVDGTLDSSLSLGVTYKGSLPSFAPAEIAGFRFCGWLDANGNEVSGEYYHNVTTDVIFYAKLEPLEYKVRFMPNGGETVTKEKTVVFRQSYGELPTPIKCGYVFSGWHTLDGTLVTENDIVTNAENIKLYAEWTEITADTEAVFKGNSMVSTGCEIIAAVNVLLLAYSVVRRRRLAPKNKK